MAYGYSSGTSTPSYLPRQNSSTYVAPAVGGANLTSSSPTLSNAGSSSSSAAARLGATRSRTLLFLSYRESVPRSSSRGRNFDDGEWSSGGGGGGGGGGSSSADFKGKGKRKEGAYFDAQGELHESALPSYPPPPSDDTRIDMGTKDTLPPKWFDVSDEVDTILSALVPKMSALDRLHNKHALPGFTDRSGEEREIERRTSEITKEFRQCSRLIASLAAHVKTLQRSPNPSSREIRMLQNVQTALATRVQDASAAFRRKQALYMQRLKGHEIRDQDIRNANGLGGRSKRENEEAVREDMELSRQHLSKSSINAAASSSQTQLLLSEEEQSHASPADADIVARSHEIDQIARSIADLASLFQDLSALVIDQGTLLDRIDYNVENMATDMQRAVSELDTATHYQRRTGRGQCILLLILLCLLCAAVIIIKPFWRMFASSAPPPVAAAPAQAAPAAVVTGLTSELIDSLHLAGGGGGGGVGHGT